MKKPLLFTLFFICTPVLLAIRVFQQFYMLDPVTGFYLDGLGGVGTVITVTCLALVPLLALIVKLSRPGVVEPPARSTSVGIAAAFASLTLVMSAVIGFISASGAAEVTVACLSFATALSFAWQSYCSFTGVRYSGWFTLIGVVYGAVRLILTFMSYTGEITVTDTLFNIATMCLLLLFLYSSGKILSGHSGKHTSVIFYSCGLAAVFFCVDSFLANTIVMLTGINMHLHAGGHFDASYLGFAVYMVVVIFVFGVGAESGENKSKSRIETTRQP